MLDGLKRKRCNKCKYHFGQGIFDCCYKVGINHLRMLRPMRLICFKYKKKGD